MSDLRGEVEPGPEAVTGHFNEFLTLTNTGERACTLAGVPRVWFTDSAGRTIGAASSEAAGGTRQTITAQPGTDIRTLLDVVDAATKSTDLCEPVTPHGYRLLLPDTTGSISLTLPSDGAAAVPIVACSSTRVTLLTASPFLPTT